MILWCRCIVWCLYNFLCFKQKTAYEMRISDWSSDVCSSDLLVRASNHSLIATRRTARVLRSPDRMHIRLGFVTAMLLAACGVESFEPDQIGRASCRERVCPYV